MNKIHKIVKVNTSLLKRRKKLWFRRSLNKITVKNISHELKFQPTMFLYNSTILQKIFNIFARHGLHKAARCSFRHVFSLIRLRYMQSALPLLFSGIKLFFLPLTPRKILRRRRNYFKVGVARQEKQWKLAICEFFKIMDGNSNSKIHRSGNTSLGKITNAIINASVIRPPFIFQYHEKIWDIVWLHPGLRRRQRFTY